jgi:hypothetical protein
MGSNHRVVSDATNMSAFSDASFDVVIDKATSGISSRNLGYVRNRSHSLMIAFG